ncbi:MAG: ABC transporter permease [bacterium]|nr:ABC transporter permease [bacterium]
MKETIILPKRSWLRIDFREMLQYKDLFYFLALRDVKVRYKQTAIGILWAFFVPIISMVIFTVFFGNLAQIDSSGAPYPIFVYVGLVFWLFFSQALSSASGSLVSDQEMIKKIYFPRLILPSSTVIVAFIDFLIASSILCAMMFYYQFVPKPISLFLIPILILITYFTSLGMGLFLSAVNVKYRDVRYIIPFFIQMLLFLTPVIYPAKIAGEKYQWILNLNPMSGVIENARAIIIGNTPINLESLAMSIGISILLFIVGLFYFRKTEQKFADVV